MEEYNISRKFLIVGFHSSGKMEVLEDLQSNDVKVGRGFVTADPIPSDIYMPGERILHSVQDAELMFENQSYIYLQQVQSGSSVFYEGLSFYEYDNNDVFAFTPTQFNLIPKLNKDRVCVIWMDNNVTDRRWRYVQSKSKYNFNLQEMSDKDNCAEFVDKINEYDVMYFNNELPERISPVIKTLIDHPDMYEFFIERYK